MTLNMQIVIANMRCLKSKGVTYSMSGSRTGVDGTADCSGAVYSSLNVAGANLPIGNTDSLFIDLPKLGFKKVTAPFKFGDIFILGIQGQSSGAAGHTGIFFGYSTIIHCNSGANGVSINRFETVLKNAGNPPYTVFRLPEQVATKDATVEKNTKENMDNSGEIEEYSYVGDKLCVKGWHFASDPTKANSGDDTEGNTGGTVDWKSMQSRAQFFINICEDLEIPKNAALALAANAYAESRLDPSALEPMEAGGAQGHGYLQWSYQYNWGDVPNHMSRSYADARYQLEWAKANQAQWIDVGYGSWFAFWSGHKSPEKLTLAWLMSWERPETPVDRWTPFTQVVDVDALTYGKSRSKKTKIKATEDVKAATEVMEIFDATNDKKIKTVEVELKRRQDIAKNNPDVAGVEWSGIDLCITFENSNPFYIQFVRIRSDGQRKILHLQMLFFPHSSSRINIGHDYRNDNNFVIETTDRKGKKQFVRKIIGSLSWTISPNEIPSCSFTIPAYEAEKFDGHIDCKIVVYGKVFDGIVKDIELHKENETAVIQLDHKISEWDYRQIPDNYTIKNQTFSAVFSQSPFLYSTDWYIDLDSVAHKEKVNYAFSRQGHLEALSKATSLTDNLWWRVGTRYNRYLEIGAFGKKKNYILSETGQTEKHIRIIGEISISKHFDDVYNVATVYGEKSDSSQTSLTLREAYIDQQRQGHDIIKGFPIVILNPTANTEQKNYYTNITKIASNNSLEYAILDEFSINLEQGKLIENTISMNDLSPFEENGEKISDEERAKQARIAYNVGVRRLKSARRRDEIRVPIGKLPCDLNVMDRIYFDYHNSIVLFDKCSRYCKKIYSASDEFYITKIETTFDENLIETNTLTLSKELSRDGSNY